MTTLKDMLKQQLVAKTLPQFKTWLGQRVKVTDECGADWVGTLTFVGQSVRKDAMQATVNSTPIFPIDINNIKLI